jgi:hypothetical protein
MSHQPLDKNFVSELDQFLEAFDKKHPILTESQQKERSKYIRIYRLRDTTERSEPAKKLWEGF